MLEVPRPSEARADALLEAQRQVLEMIVRGGALRDVLSELCLLVEAQAERQVRAAILLVDEAGKHLYTGAAPSLPDAYNRAIDGIAIAPDVGTCCAAAASGLSVVTTDFTSDPAWALLRHLPLELGLRAAWSLPILSAAGAVLGTFGTYFMEPRGPSPHERRLVEVLARTAALAIERQRVDETLRARSRHNQFLAELASTTQQLVEPHEVMATTARMLTEHLGADRCAYAEVEDEQIFVITGDYGVNVPSIVGRWPVAAFGPECVRCMLEGQPFIVDDVSSTPSILPEHVPAYQATTINAVVCVPLHKHGRFTAAMAVHQTMPRRWLADEVEVIGVVVARCWEALERVRVTRTLLESEARYRAMVEASPECVKVVAADGTLLQMNAAGLRMLEASSEQSALGRSIYDAIAPEHRALFQQLNERVCRGEAGTLHFDIVGRTGKRRSVETHAVPLSTPGGGFTHLAITRDVTERAQADGALAESRARLDYAVRLSGVGFWYCDLPFAELSWDERVKEHFFLLPDARVTIDTFYERIHPDDRAATRAAIEESISSGRSYDVVYRTLEPESGAIKWVRALGGTAYDASGQPKRFDGVTLDVTAQKRDQEELSRLLERERHQARLLKKVAQAALTIHATSSLDSVLRVVTEEARAIIGAHQAVTSLTADGDGSQDIHSVSLSDKYGSYRSYDENPTGVGIYAEVCRTNKPMRLTQEALEAHPSFRNFSGEEARHPPMRGWLAVPFVARSGKNLGLVQLTDKLEGEFSESDEAILVQLAQIAAIAIENARLYDQLRDQDRRKNEFLATLAHELRNPLAPIRTGLHVLRAGADPVQTQRAHEMMERQLGHMVRMVDDLLDISRITLGKVTLQKQRMDFRSAVHSALETTRPLMEAARHQLSVHLPEQPLMVHADATRLSQVLANLLNNAAKYTPAGGRIQLDAKAQQGSLMVRVIDTGVGIPADMVTRVFDMFTQVGRTIDRSQGGLGIGLTLVRRLAEMHGGTVQAESEGAGLGTTMTLRLPLLEQAAGSEEPATQGSAPHSAGPLRVLVVDDNVDGAESLAMLLELNGHLTRMAHTGPDALEAATAFEPHLVFLDIGLPGLNGYEVAKRLRANGAVRQPVLVALTGWGTEEDRRQAHAAGFDRHLVKPFDTAKLVEILSGVRA